MAALGSLIVKLALEHAEYTQGLTKSEHVTAEHERRIRANFLRMQQSVRDFGSSAPAIHEVTAELERSERAAKSAATGIRTALAGVFAGLSVGSIIKASDSWGQYASRMEQATRSTAEYEYAQKRMLASANNTFRSLNETRESFIQLSPILRSTGQTLEQSMDTIDTFSGLLVVNAAKTEAAATAQKNYSRALQKGEIDGKTWLSLATTMPSVVKLISDHMNRAEEDVRTLGINGKLSLSDFNAALLQSKDIVQQQVDGMRTSVADAGQRVINTFGEIIGSTNDAVGATGVLVKGMNALSEHMGSVLTVALAAGTAGAVRYTAAVGQAAVTSLSKTMAGRAQAAQELQLAQAQANQTAATLAQVTALKGLGASHAQVTAAEVAHEAAQRRLTAAQAAYTSGARMVMGFLGGPAGIAMLVAGAATAWLAFSDRTEEAAKSLLDIQQPMDQVIDKFQQLDVLQQRAEVATQTKKLTQAVQEQEDAYAQLARTVERTLSNSFRSAFLSMDDSGHRSTATIEQWKAELLAARGDAQQMASVLDRMVQAGVIPQSAIDSITAEAAAVAHANDKVSQHEQFVQKLTGVLDANTAAKLANADATNRISDETAKALADLDRQIALYGKSTASAKLRWELEEGALKDVTGAEREAYEQRLKTLTQLDQRAAASKAVASGTQSEETALRARLLAEEELLARLKQHGLAADALSEGERAVIKLEQELAGKLTERVRREKEKALAVAQQFAATQNLTKAEKERLKYEKDLVDKVTQSAASIEEQALAQERQNEAFGLGKAALTELTIAHLENELVQARTAKEVIPAHIKALERQIAAYKRLRDATAFGEELEKEQKAREEIAREAEKATEDLARSLTDNIMRGGKSALDYIRDYARTLVLRPVIQAVMMPLSGMVTSAFAGQGGAGASGSLGLGNMPFGGAGSGLLGGLGGSLGLFSSYAGAGSAALWSGSFGYGLNSIGALFGAGNIAGGLGMLTGFLGPIIAGISLISGLLSKSDPHVGATGWYETGKDAWNTNYQGDKYNADIGDTVQQFAGALGPMLEGFLRGFGIGGDVRVGTGWVDDFDGDGPSFGDFKFYLDGEKIIDWQDLVGGSKKFSPEEKGYEEFVAEVLRDAMSAIAEMDIAAWAKDQIGQLGASATLEEVAAVLQSIGLMQLAFGEWGKQVSGFATLTDAAISKLLDAAGGFDNLASGMSAYYQNFYSEEEQLAYQTAALTEVLASVGLTLPETRDGFRELVDAQMALGEEGAEALAALLGVAQAFANITPAAEDATEALGQLRRDATDSAWSALQKSIAAERTAAQARVSAAQELVSELGSIFDLLGDNVRDLWQQVDSTRAWSAAQGRAFIRNALTGARTSGYLPDADELGQAIDAARSGIEASHYSTRSAYEIEQLKLAAELAELQDISGGQLSIAERELLAAQEAVDYLDKLLEQARMDYEVARGTYQALLDLPSAWQAFQDALAAEQALLNPDATPMPKPGVTNNEGVGGGSGSGGGEGTGPYGGNATGPQGTPVPKPGVVEVEIVPMKDDSAWNSLQSILDTPASASAGDGSLQSKLETLLQDSATAATDDAALDKRKLPAFASGGAHLGGWRLVGEEGPELEFTAPAHIFNAQLTRRILQGGLDDATATGNAEVLAALQRQYELWVALGQPLLAGVADIESTLRKFDQRGVLQRQAREEATA